MKDYYKILGITQDAPHSDIRSAYRIRAKATHPDINHYPGAAEAFVEVNEAWEILSDARKRATYDRQLAWALNHLKEQALMREQQKQQQQQQQATRTQSPPPPQARPKQQSASPPPPPKAAPDMEAWARVAQQRAHTHARMKYSEFEKTKFYRMERSIQNAMIWPMFALGGLLTLFILLLPFVLTFATGWPAILLGVVAFPVAFKSFSILQNTLREYRNTQ